MTVTPGGGPDRLGQVHVNRPARAAGGPEFSAAELGGSQVRPGPQRGPPANSRHGRRPTRIRTDPSLLPGRPAGGSTRRVAAGAAGPASSEAGPAAAPPAVRSAA